MNFSDLAERIYVLQPSATPQEIARLCLLMCNSVTDIDELQLPERFNQAWQDVGMRVNAATDQHAAMTEELEQLANSDSPELSREKMWVLVRALKVQSQMLQMYVGESSVA